MISKIHEAHNNWAHTASYVYRKVEKGLGHRLMTGTFVGTTKDEVLAEGAQLRAQLGTLDAKDVFHASLRLPAGESLTNLQWADIATRYMSEMGFAETPWFAVTHTDALSAAGDGEHIHIVAVRYTINPKTGRKKRVPNFNDWRRSGEVTAAIERDYGLTQVDRSPGRKGPRTYEVRDAERNPTEEDPRQAIWQAIEEGRTKARDLPEYARVLHGRGIAVVPNVGKTGEKVSGLRYVDRKSGRSFRAAELGPEAQLKGLAEHGVERGDLELLRGLKADDPFARRPLTVYDEKRRARWLAYRDGPTLPKKAVGGVETPSVKVTSPERPATPSPGLPVPNAPKAAPTKAVALARSLSAPVLTGPPSASEPSVGGGAQARHRQTWTIAQEAEAAWEAQLRAARRVQLGDDEEGLINPSTGLGVGSGSTGLAIGSGSRAAAVGARLARALLLRTPSPATPEVQHLHRQWTAWLASHGIAEPDLQHPEQVQALLEANPDLVAAVMRGLPRSGKRGQGLADWIRAREETTEGGHGIEWFLCGPDCSRRLHDFSAFGREVPAEVRRLQAQWTAWLATHGISEPLLTKPERVQALLEVDRAKVTAVMRGLGEPSPQAEGLAQWLARQDKEGGYGIEWFLCGPGAEARMARFVQLGQIQEVSAPVQDLHDQWAAWLATHGIAEPTIRRPDRVQIMLETEPEKVAAVMRGLDSPQGVRLAQWIAKNAGNTKGGYGVEWLLCGPQAKRRLKTFQALGRKALAQNEGPSAEATSPASAEVLQLHNQWTAWLASHGIAEPDLVRPERVQALLEADPEPVWAAMRGLEASGDRADSLARWLSTHEKSEGGGYGIEWFVCGPQSSRRLDEFGAFGKVQRDEANPDRGHAPALGPLVLVPRRGPVLPRGGVPDFDPVPSERFTPHLRWPHLPTDPVGPALQRGWSEETRSLWQRILNPAHRLTRAQAAAQRTQVLTSLPSLESDTTTVQEGRMWVYRSTTDPSVFEGRRPSVVVRQGERYIAAFAADLGEGHSRDARGLVARASEALPGDPVASLPLPSEGTRLVHLAPTARDEGLQRAVDAARQDVHAQLERLFALVGGQERFDPLASQSGAAFRVVAREIEELGQLDGTAPMAVLAHEREKGFVAIYRMPVPIHTDPVELRLDREALEVAAERLPGHLASTVPLPGDGGRLVHLREVDDLVLESAFLSTREVISYAHALELESKQGPNRAFEREPDVDLDL